MLLDKKIDEYSDELFLDLGLVNLPEDQKAEIYARLQDHLHNVILQSLAKVISHVELGEIRQVIDQEDYPRLSMLLKNYPQHTVDLKERIQEEFDRLKLIIAEEQKNAYQ
ncbi:MAG: hypothetical protein Q8R08_00990 [bacterium]|nr:hypothetical protein [bacterium]